MTVDPLESASIAVADTEITTSLAAALRQLAQLPPATDVPYVTASVDWSIDGAAPGHTPGEALKASQRREMGQPQGTTKRTGRGEIERELKQAAEQHDPRSEVRASLVADGEKIADYLDNELTTAAQGAFVVSRAAGDVFVPLALAMPVPTRLRVGATPDLSPLVRMVEENPPYAVLLGDQAQSHLTVVSRTRPVGSLSLTGSKYPRHQKQGGSQRRYQNRAQNRIDEFVKETALAAADIVTNNGIETVIVAGDEVFTSALEAGMPNALRERIKATIRLDVRATDKEIVDATLPIVEQLERDTELRVAKALADAVGADNRGAGGAVRVLNALQASQVATLVMNEDYEEDGWADFTMGMYGVGPVPTTHPAGGDVANLVDIDFDEELLRLAVLTDAEIEIVDIEVPVSTEGEVPRAGQEFPRSEAATVLDGFGGVGALLRF